MKFHWTIISWRGWGTQTPYLESATTDQLLIKIIKGQGNICFSLVDVEFNTWDIRSNKFNLGRKKIGESSYWFVIFSSYKRLNRLTDLWGHRFKICFGWTPYCYVIVHWNFSFFNTFLICYLSFTCWRICILMTCFQVSQLGWNPVRAQSLSALNLTCQI